MNTLLRSPLLHRHGRLLYGAFLLTASVVLPQNTLAATCTSPPAGLVNWWRVEGTGNDDAGNDDGAVINGTTFATGHVGDAFHFDGQSGGVDIGAAAIPPPWTAEAWVRREDSPFESAVLMSDPVAALKLEQYPNTRKVGVTAWDIQDYTFDYEAPVGTWVHLAFVGTTTNVQLYVNGALEDTLDVSISLPRGRIGNDISGRFTNRYKGDLDELSLYNRALAPADIQAIVNAGSAGKCFVPDCVAPPAGLINWWPASVSPDDVVGGNIATLVGGATYAPGHVGSAFLLDGVDDRIDIRANPVPVPWTAEFWVHREASPDTSAILLGDANYALKLEQHPNTELVGFTVYDVEDYSFNYTAPVDQWVHLVFVGTGAGVSLYVNGVFQDSVAASMPLPRGAMGDDIAGRFNNRLKARIDEPSVYNRALGAAEIAALHAAGSAGKCPATEAPPNDYFAQRQYIPLIPLGPDGTDLDAHNLGATLEPGEPEISGSGFGGRSVWYTFLPTEPGMVRVVLADPPACCYDIATYGLRLGQGTGADDLIPIGEPFLFDNGNLLSRYWVVYGDLRPGQEYPLAVDGEYAEGFVDNGFFSLNIQFFPAPANDDFEQRAPITSNDQSEEIALQAASRQSGEPSHGGGNGSLWWTWTAPADGQATVRATQAGDFVPRVAAYQGDDLASLATVAPLTLEHIGHTRQLTFDAEAGQTYALAVSGSKYDTNAFPHTSEENFAAGRFEFTFATLGLRISNTMGTTNASDEVVFTGTARVHSYGNTTSGPLRLRLIAKPGYSRTEFGGCQGCTGDTNILLSTFAPLPEAAIPPGLSDPFAFNGACPAPLQEELFSGQGFEVFGLLEEQFGSIWFLQDKRLILQGAWPNVGGYGGPGAGLVRLEASLSGTPFDQLQSVEILGPSPIYGGDQVAYVALAHFLVNGDIAFTNTLWIAPPFPITNGVLESQSVAANTEVPVSVAYTFGSIASTNTRSILVVAGPELDPDGFSFNDEGFGFPVHGLPGRDHIIDAASGLDSVPDWTPIATNQPAPNGGPLGIWPFVDPDAGAFPRRFYRVRVVD